MNMQAEKPTRAEMVHELMVKLGEIEFALEGGKSDDLEGLLSQQKKLQALLIKLTDGAPKSLPEQAAA